MDVPLPTGRKCYIGLARKIDRTPADRQEASDPPPAKVTSAALDFVKATVAEADVNPDLGIVHYRKRAKR